MKAIYKAKNLSSLPIIIFLLGSAWYFPKFFNGGLVVGADISEAGIFRQIFFGAAYLAALFSVLRNLRVVTPLLMQQWLNGVLLIFVLGSVFWSVAPAKVLTNFGHLFGAFLIALTAGYNLRNDPLKYFRILALFEILSLGASILLALIQPGYGQMLIGDTVRWSGIGSHPNQLGLFGAIGVWSALSLYKVSFLSWDKALALLVLVAGVVVIIGANSITSLIVAIVMLVWFLFVGASVNLKSVVLRAFFGVFMLVILMLVVHIAAPELLGLDTFFSVTGRSENFSGRTDLWATALRAVEERTLSGWGFDSLLSLEDRFGISYGQFHNGYLDLLVRGGVVALGVVFLMLIRAVFSGLRGWTGCTGVAVAGLGMCVFAMLHNITEASLVRTAHPLWVMLLVAVIALGACDSKSTNGNSRGMAHRNDIQPRD